jgi:methyl-accepting chemotaxis protein
MKGKEISYLYTVRLLDENMTEFILDGEQINSEEWESPGSIEQNNETTLLAYETKTQQIMMPTKTEKYGTLIGSITPIIENGTGNMVGAVGVDYNIDRVLIKMNEFVMIQIVFLFLALSISWIIMREIKRKPE